MAASTATAPPPPPAPIGQQIQDVIAGGPAAWLPLLTALGHALLNLAIGVGMLLVTLWVADWVAKLARDATGRLHGGSPLHKPDAVLSEFIASLSRYTVIVIGVIAVLQQIGVQTTSVLAVLGAASLAIGLALQGGLSNVAAGVMILFLRPYRIGDQVTIGGVQGKVSGLDLFVTRIHDFDNVMVLIPNSKVLGDSISNYSMPGSHRIVMTFGIDYADDVDLALALLLEVAKADPRVLAKPEPWAKLTALGDSSVTVTLRAWTKPEVYRDTQFDLTKAVKARFEAEGLSFPYPHQVAVETRPYAPPDRERQAKALAALRARPEVKSS